MPTIEELNCIGNIISVLVIPPTIQINEMPTLENRILIQFIIMVLGTLKSGHISGMARLESANYNGILLYTLNLIT